MSNIKKIIIVILVTSVLIGLIYFSYNKSTQDDFEQSKEYFKNLESFEVPEPGYESNLVRIYLPLGVKVESELDNNIILSKGSQPFIFFINPNEDQSSQEMYNATLEQYDKESLLMNETNLENNIHSFLIVKKLDDKMYEVVVGIGRKKMTTETKKTNISESVETMLTILRSTEMK